MFMSKYVGTVFEFLAWDVQSKRSTEQHFSVRLGRTEVYAKVERFNPPLPRAQCRPLVDFGGPDRVKVTLFRRWYVVLRAARHSVDDMQRMPVVLNEGL